jgi:hypothetical protein
MPEPPLSRLLASAPLRGAGRINVRDPRASAARGVENDGGVCLALLLARRAPYALGDGGAWGALRPAPLHEPPRDRRSHAGKEARLVRLPRHNEVVPVRWSLLCRVRSRYAPRSRPDRYHETPGARVTVRLRETADTPQQLQTSAPPGREPPHRPDQPEVTDGVRDLGPPLRLEVAEQLEPAGFMGAVMRPAQRHHAVGVIAAAE